MKNSLSELKDLPIVIGNVIITGLLSASKEIYSAIDVATKTTIFVQPPKGSNLKVGKIYAVLGRLANLGFNNKNNLMIYVYTISKSRITHTDELKVYIPTKDISLPDNQYPTNKMKYGVKQYQKLIISTKESETIHLLLDCWNPSYEEDYLEFVYGPDKLKTCNTYDMLNLTLTEKITPYSSFKWICNKFNIELN